MQGRKLRMAVIVAAGLTALAMPATSHAGTIHIGVGDDFFEPEKVSQPFTGALFQWDWNDDAANSHNVRQDNRLFRSGAPTSNPTTTYGAFFLPAGRYHYYCEEHGPPNGDMAGAIRVTPTIGTPEGDEVPVAWAQDSPDRVGDRWQVQYRVNGGDWKSWLKSTAKLKARFGRNDKPVNYNPNRSYDVRVKTSLASNPKRKSQFSPAQSFAD